MDDKRTKKNDLSLLLLQESVWGMEDKIKVIDDTVAEHEAELSKLKRTIQAHADRLNRLKINNNDQKTNDKRKQSHKS